MASRGHAIKVDLDATAEQPASRGVHDDDDDEGDGPTAIIFVGSLSTGRLR